MPMHKLAEGPITMTVAAIQEVEGNFGTQYKLTSTDGVDVYVNVKPFERQLTRLSLDPESVVGETIRMEQVKKDGTTFTNVYKANAGEAGTNHATGGGTAPASAPRQAPAKAMTVAEASALYKEAVLGTYGTLASACEELGVPVTADAINAAAATVVIAATRR